MKRSKNKNKNLNNNNALLSCTIDPNHILILNGNVCVSLYYPFNYIMVKKFVSIFCFLLQFE